MLWSLSDGDRWLMRSRDSSSHSISSGDLRRIADGASLATDLSSACEVESDETTEQLLDTELR